MIRNPRPDLISTLPKNLPVPKMLCPPLQRPSLLLQLLPLILKPPPAPHARTEPPRQLLLIRSLQLRKRDLSQTVVLERGWVIVRVAGTQGVGEREEGGGRAVEGDEGRVVGVEFPSTCKKGGAGAGEGGKAFEAFEDGHGEW